MDNIYPISSYLLIQDQTGKNRQMGGEKRSSRKTCRPSQNFWRVGHHARAFADICSQDEDDDDEDEENDDRTSGCWDLARGGLGRGGHSAHSWYLLAGSPKGEKNRFAIWRAGPAGP